MPATLGVVGFVALARETNVIDEVAWVVGDGPIWRSEVEEAYSQLQYENQRLQGDPYCVIPERLAIEKLYLHQADMDTVEVAESAVSAQVESRINYFIANLGSKEKVEEYFRKPLPELRSELSETIRNMSKIRMVQESLTKDIKVTPSEVRKYFDKLPSDSVPYIPLTVEVQLITVNPVIPREEIEDVKSRLRGFADKVNSGESDFSTLAILYSEDPGSAIRGGELGFAGRATLDPAYANVAFNLNDPKRVSKIVETQYGYHIIQLIEKRGDRINTRHILLRPKVSDKALTDALARLDSVRADIVDKKKLTFEQAVPYVSQDKDTRNNHGIMVNENTGNARFEMSELPQEVAKEVAKLQEGEISKPFIMKDPKKNSDIVGMVKLTARIDGHKANLADDYQAIKDMYEAAERERILTQWLENKINETYVKIEDGWRNCTFEHKGWIKQN